MNLLHFAAALQLLLLYHTVQGYRCICNNAEAYYIHQRPDPNSFNLGLAYPGDCFPYVATEGSYWKTKVNGMDGYFWIVGYSEPHITNCGNPIRDIGSSGDCLLVMYNSYFFSQPDRNSKYRINTLPPCRSKTDCAQLLNGNSFNQNGDRWYKIDYKGTIGYAIADNDYIMRWHCGFPPPQNNGGSSHTGSGSTHQTGSNGGNPQQVQIIYVTQPPPQTTKAPMVTQHHTTPYINPSMFPVCSHSRVAFSVGNAPLSHPSAATCPDGTHTPKEAFVLNACNAPAVSSWHRGPKVMDYCLQIPKYTPIATFVHFGVYNPTHADSGIGVFVSCEGNGFMIILQLCGMNPTTVHLSKGDSDYVSNADNYYVIQWHSP